MYTDMYTPIQTCIHLCIHLYRHLYRHVFRHVYRNVFKHVNRHVIRHVYRHVQCIHVVKCLLQKIRLDLYQSRYKSFPLVNPRGIELFSSVIRYQSRHILAYSQVSMFRDTTQRYFSINVDPDTILSVSILNYMTLSVSVPNLYLSKKGFKMLLLG